MIENRTGSVFNQGSDFGVCKCSPSVLSPVFIACFDGDRTARRSARRRSRHGSRSRRRRSCKRRSANADHAVSRRMQLNKLLAEEKRKGEAKLKAVLAEKQALVDKLLTDKRISRTGARCLADREGRVGQSNCSPKRSG